MDLLKDEVFTFHITIDSVENVQGHTGSCTLIRFGGWSDCDAFHGRVLPGGVDTQIEWAGQPRILSARYILEGTDAAGNPCRIFVENVGQMQEGQEMRTVPRILTDSPLLAYLEKADLVGTITPEPQGVGIHISVITDKQC